MKKKINRSSEELEADEYSEDGISMPCKHRYSCPFQNGSCNPETCDDHSSE